MTGKRKRYSADFKAKVALEALRGEQTVAQLAAKHGVHQTMINAWKKQAVAGMATVSSGKAINEPDQVWCHITLAASPKVPYRECRRLG